MSDVLWEDILKQPPPPPPPPPPMGMPPPPMGGMPPPGMGMGMEPPDPPGKIVQDKPGEQQDVVAVDPDKEEDDDDNKEIEKFIADGEYQHSPQSSIQEYMRSNAQRGGWQGQLSNNEDMYETSGNQYQANMAYDKKGAGDTHLSDMHDDNIKEYWEAMVEGGHINQSEVPTKGSMAWINPLEATHEVGETWRETMMNDPDKTQMEAWQKENTKEGESAPLPSDAPKSDREKSWKDKFGGGFMTAPSRFIDRAADKVFGTDEEIRDEDWMETMTQSRPEKRMMANPEARRKKAEELVANNPRNRARELVANKKRTGENAQSTVWGDE